MSRIRELIDRFRFRARVRALESALARASQQERPMLLQELGDLHAASGSEKVAVRCFGAAIDAHLAAERFDAAAAVCRKVLRVYPETVRARGTLGFLLLGRGQPREAAQELARYLDAARAVGSAGYAAERLRMMGEVVPEPASRTLLSTLLRSLGVPAEIAPATGPVQRSAVAALLRRAVTPQRVDVHAAPVDAPRPARVEAGDDLPWLDVSLGAERDA